MSAASRKLSVRFPVYQIDFSAVACGKNVASSKRRIRWRFGFSNKEALDSGETGTACRGEEHDVTLIWSVTSGKRLIFSDGQELHYSTNRSGVFEYSWTMRGNHVIKVVAHATPPMSGNPGFRQYDLFVDGLSFFNFPKVFELGVKGNFHAPYPGVINKDDRPAPDKAYYDLTKGEYIRQPQTLEEEEQDLKIAIQASIEESRRHLSKSILSKHEEQHVHSNDQPQPVENTQALVPAPETDLLDLMGDLNITSIVPTSTQPGSYTYDGINLLNADTTAYSQPKQDYDLFDMTPVAPQAPDPFAMPTSQQVDPFAPQPLQQPQFKPPNPLDFYANSPNENNAPPVPPQNIPYFSSPPAPPQPPTAPPPTPVTPIVQDSKQPYDDTLKKLVNFDDISSPAETFSLSMNTNQAIKGKAEWNSLGPQPSLAQMQSLRSTPKKEVMNTMVPHAQQNGNYSGYAPQYYQQQAYYAQQQGYNQPQPPLNQFGQQAYGQNNAQQHWGS